MKSSVMCLVTLCLLLSGICPEMVLGEDKEGDSPDRKGLRSVDSSSPLAGSETAAGWSYNSDYVYSLSRTLRDSGLPAAAKVPLFLPSLILDTGLLPISLIAGLLGD